ncbi:MAG: hypothetical protein H6Q13_2980 [Bacteroidetes bacterium]|jgi:hypothetical protein|nr:hypothetical protein [Bacteroidota bacterium]
MQSKKRTQIIILNKNKVTLYNKLEISDNERISLWKDVTSCFL